MSDPSFAEASEKAIDHIANGVKIVTDAAQKIAPHAWDIAVAQQKSEGIANLAACAITLAAIWICGVLFVRMMQKAMIDEELLWFRALVYGVAAMLSLAAVLNWGKTGAQQLANPQYYAAAALLSAVK